MLTIQPPFIRAYFTTTNPRPLPKHIFQSFFLSWEDALWHLLRVYQAKKGATILVPEFFCGNVVSHIHAHGLSTATYRVDHKLNPSRSHFISMLKSLNPAIVVVFHSVGIANPLLSKPDDWIKYLGDKTILIEDCVHTVIDPETIRFITPRHFLIDSLRKVVPVQGSNVYSLQALAPVSMFTKFLTLPYGIWVHFWWILMQVCLVSAYHAKNISTNKWWNQRAEEAMISGYEVIGAGRLPSCGSWIMKLLAQRVKVDQVEAIKVEQFRQYHTGLKRLIKTCDFWLPKMKLSDRMGLRGYPLIVSLRVADQFLDMVRQKGLLLRFELNDYIWSEKQKVVYLPMGVHVSNKEIEYVIKILGSIKLC